MEWVILSVEAEVWIDVIGVEMEVAIPQTMTKEGVMRVQKRNSSKRLTVMGGPKIDGRIGMMAATKARDGAGENMVSGGGANDWRDGCPDCPAELAS